MISPTWAGLPLTLQRSGGTLDPAAKRLRLEVVPWASGGGERYGRAGAAHSQAPVTGPRGGPGRGVAGADRGHLLLPDQEDRHQPGVDGDHRHDLAGVDPPWPACRLEPVHL